MAIFASCISARRVQHISDMHSKFALRPHHVWKYGRHPIADRWDQARKKRRRRKKKKDWNHRAKMKCPHLLCRAVIKSTVNSLQRRQTRRSTRHTILWCDELTVWQVDWFPSDFACRSFHPEFTPIHHLQATGRPSHMVSEIWNFQNSQLDIQVGYPSYSQQSIDTIAYDKILLITVLHCNIYLSLKFWTKFCSPLWKASYQQKRNRLCNTQWRQFSKSLGPARNRFTAVRSPWRNIRNWCILWSTNFHVFIYRRLVDLQAL